MEGVSGINGATVTTVTVAGSKHSNANNHSKRIFELLLSINVITKGVLNTQEQRRAPKNEHGNCALR